MPPIEIIEKIEHHRINQNMLQNWLQPIKTEDFPNTNRFQFGEKIQIFESEFPDISKTKVAIIGIGTKDANAVRKELYQLSYPFRRLKISDLGNVRKKAHSFVIPIIKELLDSKILPIIIGDSNFFTQAQYQAHQAFQQSLNLCLIDEKIHFHPRLKEEDGNYLNPILQKADADLFNLSVIGCQSHFVDDNIFSDLDERNFEVVRLGQARTDLPEMEPVIRDADLVSFNLAALKNLEASAVEHQTPSGFFNEEACQISRYAGMSDKLTSIGFYGFQNKLDKNGQTAKVVAQLIWYFLDGVYHRKSDFPATMSGLTEYIVAFKSHDYEITFWKSEKSNRWWMQVPIKTDRKMRRHKLIPCSYKDYLNACNEELPERLLRAHSRFK